GLGGLKPGQRAFTRLTRLGNRVAHAGVGDFLDGRCQKADFARPDLVHLLREWGKGSKTNGLVVAPGRQQPDLLLDPQGTVDHAYEQHDAAVAVVPAVEEKNLQ